ncbi:MAG: HNH endonuclease signature motif containing protein [Nitriliruptor sp.]
MGAPRYTDQQFRDAVGDPEVRTIADLCRALGIVPRGGNYETLRRRAARLGLAVPPVRQRAALVPIDDDLLRSAVESSRSIAAVLRRLGLPDAGGTRARVTRAISRLGLDTSHHTGQAWSRGQEVARRRVRLDQLNDGTNRAGGTIKAVLLRSGWSHRCQVCGRDDWDGAPIPLEVDHIDGDRRNNDVSNLRLICPNCHALTPTYRGRNIGRVYHQPKPTERGQS